jgi:hypothetical protein
MGKDLPEIGVFVSRFPRIPEPIMLTAMARGF